MNFFAVVCRVLPVFEEHHRVGPRDRDLADLAWFHAPALGVDDRDLVTRHDFADSAGAADADAGAGAEHEVAFGLAVELVDVTPSAAFAHSKVSRPSDSPAEQTVRNSSRKRRLMSGTDFSMRSAVGGMNAFLIRIFSIRPSAVSGSNFSNRAGDNRHAEIERRQQRVEQAARPCPVGWRPHQIARLRQELVGICTPGRWPSSTRWPCSAPLGGPVVPEVKIINAGSSGPVSSATKSGE